MGLKVHMPEVHEQIQGINNILNEKIKSAESVLQALESFINDGELIGKSYRSAQIYFDVTYGALTRGMIRANEEIIKANQKFISQFQSLVDPSPLAVIDEAQLLILIDKVTHWQNLLKNAILDGFTFNRQHLIQEIFKAKQMLQMIEDLRVFNGLSFYEYAEYLLIQIETGLLMISDENYWNEDTQTYEFTLTDMEWSQILSKDWKYSFLDDDEKFSQQMKEQFGFEEEEIKLMLKLKEKLKEKFPDATQVELDYYFTRLIGGFSYGGPGWNRDEIKWKQTAGSPYNGMSEEEFFTKYLGFSKKEYKLLRYKSRIQNQIVSTPEKLSWKQIEKDGQIDIYKASLEKAIGRKLTKEEFKKYWINQYNNMVNKGDFSHQQITTSSMLYDGSYSLLHNLYPGKEKIEDLAGWLGDATLGDPPSFGDDDYKADLDAENINYLMKTHHLSYQDAVNKYYQEVGKSYTRAELFLKHTPIEKVKEQVFSELKIKDMNELKEKAPETYNFIRSLEENKHEMGSYE
ncbi:hypothetical protein [Pueribacillus sp. YX66]|uniref:hypothetical protein n=1 Tax=Pueribacillus sp. YX66 TaxID=3229242 RepID=UPI00358D18E0